MTVCYYDYTPDDAVVQWVTDGKPQVIHLYNRDGVYKGTITNSLIVSRAWSNWTTATIEGARMFLIMVAEVFPQTLLNMHMPDMPAWHPSLPRKDENCKKKRIPFITGPIQGGTCSSSELTAYLLVNQQVDDDEDDWHLYRLDLDPTTDCGYFHVISGSRKTVGQYCVDNNIQCNL